MPEIQNNNILDSQVTLENDSEVLNNAPESFLKDIVNNASNLSKTLDKVVPTYEKSDDDVFEALDKQEEKIYEKSDELVKKLNLEETINNDKSTDDDIFEALDKQEEKIYENSNKLVINNEKSTDDDVFKALDKQEELIYERSDKLVDNSREKSKNNFKKAIYEEVIGSKISDNSANNIIKDMDKNLDENFDSFDKNHDGEINNSEKEEILSSLNKNIIGKIDLSIEKDEMKNILKSVIENNFKEEVSLDFSYGHRKYQSIENYSPEIDIKTDYSENIKNYVKQHYREGSGLNHLGEKLNNSDGSLENSPEENKKLQLIINDFYESNKEIIDKKLGINSINNLEPAQAAKLSAFITMSKIDYNYAQAITPGSEENYYDNLNEEEKKQYKKDLYISSIVASLGDYDEYIGNFIGIVDGEQTINTSTIRQQGRKFYDEINSDISDKELSNINKLSFDEIRQKAQEMADSKMISEYGYSKEDLKGFKKESILKGFSDATKEVFVANSQIFIENGKYDKMNVSELLESGKGVCRNYAISNEKLFEAMKGFQKDGNNKLQNSVLVYYDGNDSGAKTNQNMANSENGTNGHAWNALITVGKDGKEYVAQLDATWSDTGGKEGGKKETDGIKQVDTLDRTYERLFNDLADNLTENEFKKVDGKIKNYILAMENTDGNQNQISLMKEKLFNFYSQLGKKEERVSALKDLVSDIGFDSKDIKDMEKTGLLDNEDIRIFNGWKAYKENNQNITGDDLNYLNVNDNWGSLKDKTLEERIGILNDYSNVDSSLSGKDVIYLINFGYNIYEEGSEDKKDIIKKVRKENPLLHGQELIDELKKITR